MSKYIKMGLSIVVIVALAVGGIKAVKNAKAKDASTPKAKIYPIVVKTFLPKIKETKLTLPYLAEVKNDKDVTLSSRIAARIIDIKQSGATVKKGEVIARLDTLNIKSDLKNIRNQIESANIELTNLKATHKRTQDLLDVKGASIEQFQKETTMIAGVQTKIAGLKLKEIELKNNLSYAVITSPVDGVIAQLMGHKGAMSMPGKPIAKISSKNGFYLMLRVPREIEIKGVEFHNTKFGITALGSTFHGLSEYKVYINDIKLTSGDRVEVDVITYDSKGMFLPFDTLLNRNGKSFVLIVSGTKATPKEVHILKTAQQGVIISENLENMKIVLAKPDILLKLISGHILKVKG